MFDPTVYENLKVVLEGAVYDQDLAGEIEMMNRKDIVDLATMSRTYESYFKAQDCQVNITLQAGFSSFVEEKVNLNEAAAGCDLLITFTQIIKGKETRQRTLQVIKEIWENRPSVQQKVIDFYPNKSTLLETTLIFDRKITEEQISDIPAILEHTIKTALALEKI